MSLSAISLLILRAVECVTNPSGCVPSYSYCEAAYPETKTYHPLHVSVSQSIQPLTIQGKLEKIIVYHRHGARLPLKNEYGPVSWKQDCMPTLTNIDRHHDKATLYLGRHEIQNNHECLMKQLTNQGRGQLRRLGENLRQVYWNRLGGIKSGDITVRSSNST